MREFEKLRKRLRELEESHGKAVEVTVNSKEENSSDFCLDCTQEFGLCTKRKNGASVFVPKGMPSPATDRNHSRVGSYSQASLGIATEKAMRCRMPMERGCRKKAFTETFTTQQSFSSQLMLNFTFAPSWV